MLHLLEHDNIDKHKHLNRSGLHLNTTGTGILSSVQEKTIQQQSREHRTRHLHAINFQYFI